MRVEQNIEKCKSGYRVYALGKYRGTFDTLNKARSERDSFKATNIGSRRTANIEGFTERFNQAIWESDKDIAVISKMTNISRSVIWSYQNGVLPKCDNLARLAIVLNVSADWLLGIKK